MIRYANLEEARKAVIRWGGEPRSVEHLGDRGNSVFSFRNSQCEPQILRFTDPDFRSFPELVAELNFVNYLHAVDIAVAPALAALDGAWAFPAECASGILTCSSIAYAPGLEVQEGSPHWNGRFFQEWGRSLARIHEAARLFQPAPAAPKRWQWNEEILLARAEQLIPAADKKSLEEFQEVSTRCSALAKTPVNFGMIHADHAPQNFRYNAENSLLTAFDFGNCCYHWFLADLAISLSTIRRRANSESIREKILEGYSSIRALPADYSEQIDLFIRLRVLYVYLSRLHLWGAARTAEQEKSLAAFRDFVQEKTGW